jgi:hypothetical protein
MILPSSCQQSVVIKLTQQQLLRIFPKTKKAIFSIWVPKDLKACVSKTRTPTMLTKEKNIFSLLEKRFVKENLTKQLMAKSLTPKAV